LRFPWKTSSSKLKKIKGQLAGLKRSQSFIDWRGIRAFAKKLQSILAEIHSNVKEPADGVELVAQFFECDTATLGRCDDSNGYVGDVFRISALGLFVYFAKDCSDKSLLAERLTLLCTKDGYGVRDCLINSASEFLPPENLRHLADQFWEKATAAEISDEDDYQLRHCMYTVESLAYQLKDAKLFEKARLRYGPRITTASCVAISDAYLHAGDAATALSWIERIPSTETFMEEERNHLLLSINEQLGNTEATNETAWNIFHKDRNEETFRILLSVIGEDKRDKVIEDETELILSSEPFSYSNAFFLIDLEQMDAAQSYMINHAQELNGDFYDAVLPMAQAMEKHKRWLAACVGYRELLDSILQRAISKYYHHGVRYLKKLDALAKKIQDWQDVTPHDQYKEGILETHYRKSSFWKKYQGFAPSKKRSSGKPWTIVKRPEN